MVGSQLQPVALENGCGFLTIARHFYSVWTLP